MIISNSYELCQKGSVNFLWNPTLVIWVNFLSRKGFAGKQHIKVAITYKRDYRLFRGNKTEGAFLNLEWILSFFTTDGQFPDSRYWPIFHFFFFLIYIPSILCCTNKYKTPRKFCKKTWVWNCNDCWCRKTIVRHIFLIIP